MVNWQTSQVAASLPPQVVSISIESVMPNAYHLFLWRSILRKFNPYTRWEDALNKKCFWIQMFVIKLQLPRMDGYPSFLFHKTCCSFFPSLFRFSKKQFLCFKPSSFLSFEKVFFSSLSLSCKKKFFFFDKWKLLRHFFIFFFCVGEKIIVFVENDLCSSASESDSRIQQGKPGNKSSERIWRLIS